MNVLIVGITPPETGGSEKHIYEITKRLAKSRDIAILTQKGSSCSKFAKTIEIDLPNKPLILRNFIFLLKVFAYFLFSKRYDLVHIHENYLFLLAPLLKLKARKFIATAHGCFGFAYYENLFLRKIYFGLIKIFADTVIFVYEPEYQLFNKDIPQAKYIPNGVDTSAFKWSKTVTENIVYFGRFHPKKGITYLINAFLDIKIRYPKLRLVLIGEETEYQRTLRRMVEGISNIDFLGFVDDESLAKLLISAKAIVLPSLSEGSSLAVFSALASSRPLITTNIPANKFLERENVALLVEPADSEALASAIMKLIENNKLADKLAENGRKLSQKYDWNFIAELVGTTYGE